MDDWVYCHWVVYVDICEAGEQGRNSEVIQEPTPLKPKSPSVRPGVLLKPIPGQKTLGKTRRRAFDCERGNRA